MAEDATCERRLCARPLFASSALSTCNTGRSANRTITLQSKQRTAQHCKRWDLFARHQRPHDYTRCLNGTSCSFDFMACSVCLDVMPHSATSSVSGDDTSTTVTWNSGVFAIHLLMWVKTL